MAPGSAHLAAVRCGAGGNRMDDHTELRPPDARPGSRRDASRAPRSRPGTRRIRAEALRNVLTGVEPGGVYPEFLRRLHRPQVQQAHPFALRPTEAPRSA